MACPKTLLSKVKDQFTHTSRSQRLTESIGQDLVCDATHAGIKTPKHILLPYPVKLITKCVELICI